MVYMGSKDRIAKYLIPIITKYLTRDKWYVEPFCGGGNMIDKVHHDKKIASDINEYLIGLFKGLQEGVVLPDFVSKEEYYNVKDNKEKYPLWYVGHVGFNCSRLGKFWGGYVGIQNGRNYQKEHIQNIIKQSANLKNVIFKNKAYYELEIPLGSIVYCDPPYANTAKYRDSFDSESFWQWCRVQTVIGNDVLISEYNAPDDFVCVWNKEVSVSIAINKTYKPTEKLFVHKSIADKYITKTLFDNE